MGTAPSGRGRRKGGRTKNKQYKRGFWLSNRTKDRDQVQEEIEKIQENGGSVEQPEIPFDDELPGGGQYYCVETDKHFIDAKALADHKKSRFYKKRVKEMKEEKYTQASSEWAAGLSKEILPPAHPKK